MIGNDIVDLALAEQESNWQRPGFLDKIFTSREQSMILASHNPTLMVWNLWSRKEAAYKIYNRETGIRGYFPLQLECFDLDSIDGNIFGKVVVKDHIYFTKTEIRAEFIHTIAVKNPLDFQNIVLLKNRKNIKKDNQISNYFAEDHSAPMPISISNHGRFERIIGAFINL